MIKYVFKDTIITIKNKAKANPQKIGEALAKLAVDGGGELTPPSVVEAARAPKHPLHQFFEWDDTKAAQAFRLDQARTIIRSIHAEDEDASEGHAPAFVSVADKGGTSYRTLDAIKNSADLQARVLVAAERDLEAFRRRYTSLQDICAIIRTAQAAVAARRKKAEIRAST